MKNTKWVRAGLAVGLAMVMGLSLHAQTAATDLGSDSTSIQPEPITMNATDMATVQTLSEAELAAFISALDVTPQVSYEAIPDNGISTYYSLQHPEWAPLPADTSHSAVWQMNNFYLLDDVYFDYAAAATNFRTTTLSSSSIMTMDATTTDPLDPTSGTGGGTNIYTPNGLTPPDYGTNLWIAQVSLDNGYFTAIASNTLPLVKYEVQTNADLTTTNWGTFATYPFFYGSETTNWTALDTIAVNGDITNLFFRLRSWGSSDGSGLPDW